MFLETKNINTYYGESHVLQDLSLEMEKGETVALLGRNGMGKSTTLKSIMGLVSPRSGQIKFNGKEIAGLPSYQIARLGIGYVPEERRIFPNLSVLDNMQISIREQSSQSKSTGEGWDLERIYKHFPVLKDRSGQKGAYLSGGEQQMLAIARALMGNPDLLLVDEPTEGLAPIIVKEVRDVLNEIVQAGMTILLVEHNLKVALSLADRVYLMGKAKVGFCGTVAELEAQPEIRAEYLEV
ncbi:MAG: ABC transporter ATP-binding protein [Deltaproteobacteria bacterium]|jgi:branched-chain amino acid transport system ATP-binding protein|nr:ABC transporter ATP-binding protein [Deltaproteobacteria bacterium]MBT4639587.1 ABC transporter ATP-binding protein [Deltaproteobacteria bacterium]MBT6503980.1 ABC transporter ATP-binding protein [Deltaproteobacteria bacterium]MBT6616349.1 ABC transporter ATP-binding protein [Deltaproteobacteria bacterium]MBT7153307.1 ABC transporter ATP-binding protein [Deltaproteobacteria bacterium]